jgi:hypothetical protein
MLEQVYQLIRPFAALDILVPIRFTSCPLDVLAEVVKIQAQSRQPQVSVVQLVGNPTRPIHIRDSLVGSIVLDPRRFALQQW